MSLANIDNHFSSLTSSNLIISFILLFSFSGCFESVQRLKKSTDDKPKVISTFLVEFRKKQRARKLDQVRTIIYTTSKSETITIRIITPPLKIETISSKVEIKPNNATKPEIITKIEKTCEQIINKIDKIDKTVKPNSLIKNDMIKIKNKINNILIRDIPNSSNLMCLHIKLKQIDGQLFNILEKLDNSSYKDKNEISKFHKYLYIADDIGKIVFILLVFVGLGYFIYIKIKKKE